MTRTPIDPAAQAALFMGGLDVPSVEELLVRAVLEDLGGGADVTSLATVDEDVQGVADIRTRAAGIVAGASVAAAALNVAGNLTSGSVRIDLEVGDGDEVAPGDVLLTARGPVRSLLTGERTALNLICHLSGIATLTRRWVDAVEGTGAKIRDTRKTTPGLRALEKYAVRCGGGTNHRMSLADAALIKDNHVLAIGSVREAYDAVRSAFPDIPVEVECDTVAQVKECVEAGVDLVLLDNMSLDDMREAVAVAAGRTRLEASGGLTLDRAREVAETGVDYLAVGALTHSAPILDIGMDLRSVEG